jgi:hypothetical protein
MLHRGQAARVPVTLPGADIAFRRCGSVENTVYAGCMGISNARAGKAQAQPAAATVLRAAGIQCRFFE